MTTQQIKIENGKTMLVEVSLYTGMDAGVHVINKPFEYKTEVFESMEGANKAAAARLANWPNGVWVSNETVIVDGKEYYFPTFNVWD